jgi:uncharacterized protein (TIGR00255 family)
MIKSMTGFGRCTADGSGVKVSVDIRTVNNRYLDAHIRLPPEYASLELSIKKQIQAAFKRGRVDMTISIERGGSTGFGINRDLVRGYLGALSALKDEFGLTGEPSLELIARVPGVMQSTGAVEGGDGEVSETVAAAVSGALADLVAMRAVEGAELSNEMSTRLDIVESLLPTIEKRAQELPAQYRERLERRIADLTRGKPIDDTRLAQEAAYLAERSDIAEEIARLKSHTTQFRQTLMGDTGEAGKRLDFLLQEMNREANTILSKSGDLHISEAAITIKTEVEKLREQVQNVE